MVSCFFRWSLRLPILFLGFSFSVIPVHGQGGDYLQLQNRIVSIYNSNSAAVARVKAVSEKVDDEGESHVTLVIGTGFFVSQNGLLLTNANIAMNALRVRVEYDGNEYAADILGTDPATNLALLRVHSLPRDFHYLTLSAGAAMPVVGALVMSISSPLDFLPSPSIGLVSGHESNFGEHAFPTTLARITIPSHPGEGGAPVFDLNGRLLGIVFASLEEIDSSYILPVKAILRVRDDLQNAGHVNYGWIGVELRENNHRERGRWFTVDKVHPHGPAAMAGISAGDELVQMGDYRIRNVNDVRDANFFSRVGEFIDIRVIRGVNTFNYSVKVAPRPPDEPMPGAPEDMHGGVQEAGEEPEEIPVSATENRPNRRR